MLGHNYPRHKQNNASLTESAKLQAARCSRGIYEVLTDDKDYFKLIADARLKLEKDIAPAVPCVHCEGRQSRKTSDLCNTH